MLRIAAGTAKELLVKKSADVFRLSVNSPGLLSPLDVIKPSQILPLDANAIKAKDFPVLEKLTRQRSRDFLQQIDRDKKTTNKNRRDVL